MSRKILALILTLGLLSPSLLHAGGARHLRIQPNFVTMRGWERLQFAVTLREPDGTSRTPERLDWRCLRGQIGESGVFVAPHGTGSVQLVVRFQDLSASARIHLRPALHPPTIPPRPVVRPRPPVVVHRPPVVVHRPPVVVSEPPLSTRPDNPYEPYVTPLPSHPRRPHGDIRPTPRPPTPSVPLSDPHIKVRRWSTRTLWSRVTVKASLRAEHPRAHRFVLYVVEKDGKRRERAAAPCGNGQTVKLETSYSKGSVEAVVIHLLDGKGRVLARMRRLDGRR